MGTSETSSLLAGSKGSGSSYGGHPNKSGRFGNSDTKPGRKQSLSRFGVDVESPGVKPSGDSISNIPLILENWHKRSISSQCDSVKDFFPNRSVDPGLKPSSSSVTGGVGGIRSLSRSFTSLQPHQRARSWVMNADGSIAERNPLEMGRHELYEELPFLAVAGLQKKEHNLSVAFSSYAAALDNLEADEYVLSTTGQRLDKEEMEQRQSQISLLLLDELEADAITVTTPLIFAVLIASLLMFNAGYNISVMNAPEPYVFPGHGTSEWSVAVAAFCVGGPFGSILAGKLADRRGRRGALLITTWLFILGGLIQSLAPNLNLVVVARVLIGVASGASTVLVPIYLGELAPPNLRGVIGTMTQFALVIGILFADLVGFFLANATRWRGMFFLTSALAIFQLFLTPFLLESPRWLLSRNPDSSKARFIIKKLRGFRYDDEIETEVDHYLGASKAQQLDDDKDEKESKMAQRNITVEMFRDKKVRLLVISTLVLQVSNQLSGINAVFYYSGLFFDGVIDDPLIGTTIIGAVNVVATYAALLLMDRCGRRTLIMWSAVGMFASCIIIVMSLLGYFNKIVALFAVGTYVSFFEIGLGPIPWLIVAEMFEGKYVTAAMSVSSQLNWTCNFVVGLVFPYLNDTLGPYSFAPFAVVLLLTFIFALIWLPETQGTTPEELQAELIRKNSGTTYHNMDIEAALSSERAHPSSEYEWAQALAVLENEGTYQGQDINAVGLQV